MKHVVKFFLFVFFAIGVFGVQSVEAQSTVCHVPSVYSTIQSSIDNECYDIVLEAGTYFENIVVPDRGAEPPDVVIQGAGHDTTFLDGSGTESVISFVRGYLVLRDLTIQNGSALNGGGINYFSGTFPNGTQNAPIGIKATRVDLVGNSAEKSGGAIYFDQSFVYSTSSPLNFVDVSIRDNQAVEDGGGVYVRGNGLQSVKIMNSAVVRNVASNGGGVYLEGVDFYPKNLSLTWNEASACGGGVYFDGESQILSSSQTRAAMAGTQFGDNRARNGGGMCGRNFGELSMYSATNGTPTRMFNNIAHENGGVLHFEQFVRATILDGTQIFNNEAASGGVIYAQQNKDIPVIHGVEFRKVVAYGNNASDSGGFAYLQQAKGGIYDSILRQNKAGNMGGGVIVASDATLTIANSIVTESEAGASGGAVAVVGESAELVITTSAIENNVAADEGGGVYIEAGSATFDNLSFTGNQSTNGDGGALYSTGNVVLTDAGISNNSALLGGGVVFNQGQFTVDRVGFENNTATYFGGGVFVNFPSALSSIEDYAISNNTAQNGGGLYVYGNPRLNIARGLIAENTATGSGGGIDGNVNLTQSAVISNTATDSGGGIRTNDSRFINVTISNNSAGFAGSGLVADGLLASYTTIADNFGSPAIFNPTDGPIPVQFEHTIIYNTDTQNCAGESVQAIGVNTIDSDGSCNFYNSRNLSGVDPMLAPLAMNGGNSPTHALQDGSPAIGSGYDCPDIDQRGGSRPAGNCDLGAYQTNASVPTAIALSTQQTQTTFAVYSMILFVLLAVGTVRVLIQRSERFTN